ncbi:hypothetical protein [Thalassolituus sp.]|uniref:hypothetical protein n=1 Tax=Thalassolituus sp. TaxID=2030822 RepID=UPI002602F082|nr:hypothetical protein [Thalassolituus sp.]
MSSHSEPQIEHHLKHLCANLVRNLCGPCRFSANDASIEVLHSEASGTTVDNIPQAHSHSETNLRDVCDDIASECQRIRRFQTVLGHR